MKSLPATFLLVPTLRL